jgi:hypothetical protein
VLDAIPADGVLPVGVGEHVGGVRWEEQLPAALDVEHRNADALLRRFARQVQGLLDLVGPGSGRGHTRAQLADVVQDVLVVLVAERGRELVQVLLLEAIPVVDLDAHSGIPASRSTTS